MAEPITASLLATTCALGMVKGLSGQAASAGARRVIDRLRKQWTPEGREVLGATHAAFVHSIQLMAEACSVSGGNAADQFSARALSNFAKSRNFTEFRPDDEALPKHELDELTRAIFKNHDHDPAVAATEIIIADVEKWIGQPLTATHQSLFRHGSDKHRSWPAAFELFFAEQVKTNERVFRALAFGRLNEILAFTEAHAADMTALQEAIGSLSSDMHGRFDSLGEGIGGIGADVKEILARLSGQEWDAPIALLRSLAEAFGETRPKADAAELEAYLRAKISEYHQLRERIDTVHHEDNHDAALLADANLAIADGDFQKADQLLGEAEALLDERVDRLVLRKAERRSLRGQAARLKGDYKTAIAHYDTAARSLPKQARVERWEYARRAAEAAEEWGERIEPEALHDALKRLRRLLREIPTDKWPWEWGNIKNASAVVLCKIGKLEDGTASLRKGVSAFRMALKISGAKIGRLDWAATQNNIGNALKEIGRREGKPHFLRKAIAAYESVLQVETREDYPILWASAQNNLGNAWRALGALVNDGVYIENAIECHHRALEVRTRDRLPIQWAMGQNNLGTSLATLATLKKDPNLYIASEQAFRRALLVRKRDSMPQQWAQTSENLGRALFLRVRLCGDDGLLDEAVELFQSALEVYEHPHLKPMHAEAQRELDSARALRDRLRSV